MNKRLNTLSKSLKRNGLSGLLTCSYANIFYLTGLTNIEGYFLITPDKLILFTDFRYLKSCRKICKENNIQLIEYKFGIFKTIANQIQRLSLQKVGIEWEKISFREYKELENNLTRKNFHLVPTHGLIENIRQVKDAYEIELVRKATRFTEKTLSFAQEILYPGLKEKYLSIEIQKMLKLQGDNFLAFPPIIATGKNSAEPHHKPDKTQITKNKPVLIDLGARYKGYCADLTRVLFLSKMPLNIKKIFDIVLKAKDLSIKRIKTGVKIKDIDKAARDYIDKKGYGKYFGHALGHGVGIKVHEKPFINKTNESLLKANSIITVEPAIYLPGRFGIRHESMILVKEDGAEIIDEHI